MNTYKKMDYNCYRTSQWVQNLNVQSSFFKCTTLTVASMKEPLLDLQKHWSSNIIRV